MITSASVFVVGLLAFSVVRGQKSWSVTYSTTDVCGVKGSTVEMHCSYTSSAKVKSEFWFTKSDGDDPVPLKSDATYRSRVQYSCKNKNCTLTIGHLRESDAAVYKFRFTTQHYRGKHTGEPGVTLSVTEPRLQVTRDSASWLECSSSCHLPVHPTYVWYKNGQEVQEETWGFHSIRSGPADSFSCALRQHEEFPSPLVCAKGQTCNRVSYTDRQICVIKGSSVNISCTYHGYYQVKSKLWFSPERRHQWQNPSQPEDLRKDSQYSGRVQVFETKTGSSTLRITDLTETDSAQYHFTFRTQDFEWRSSLPGTTLTVTAVQVQVIQVVRHGFYAEAELKCHSSCSPNGRFAFVWFKNGKTLNLEATYYKGQFYPGDDVSCAIKGHEGFRSPSAHPPNPPSVSVRPSAEIVEGSSVTQTCSSDSNPAPQYTWYKKNQRMINTDPQLVFSSIQSSDSGHYYCTAENELGSSRSEDVFINVGYPPNPPSVSVSPSAEIVEGSSVTLTCSSDSNPAPQYTWYKENETVLGRSAYVHLTSVSSQEGGTYYCKSENQYGQIVSSAVRIDVQYAPNPPSVSVSPSAEIVEGSSVTLTCSSDSNPAPQYTWYKENEESPKASGQTFTITDVTHEHSGNYYCEAQNTIGRRNSTLRLTVSTGSVTSAAAGSITVLLLVVMFLCVFLFVRKKHSSKQPSGPGESPRQIAQLNVGPDYEAVQRQQAEQQDELLYTSVTFSKVQEDPLYSNIQTRHATRDQEDDVDYTAVKTDADAPRLSQGSEEDPSSLYSTVNRNHRT